MAIEITREDYIEKFGRDPFEDQGKQYPPELPPEGSYSNETQVSPPQGPESFSTPQSSPEMFPPPGPPVEDANLGAPAGPQVAPQGPGKNVMRRLVQKRFLQPLAAVVERSPEALGEEGGLLAQALQAGPEAFQNAYYGLLSEPGFQAKMVTMEQEFRDSGVSEDYGQPTSLTPEKMLQEGVLASFMKERRDALKVGATAATDLSRMADLMDEATGKSDGMNEHYRTDMVALTGVARDSILRPLTDTGDLDGATRFDEFLDALEEDIMGLAGQGYHPNAVPVRIALQLRMEVDKNPDLMEDSGYGRALRQLRGLMKQELEGKIAKGAGLTGAVSPSEWREAMGAYDQAFEIAKVTEPATYRRRRNDDRDIE